MVLDVVRVLRDPSGARPCFISEIEGVRIFFSDAEDFLRLAPDTRADLGFLRAFLRYPPYLGRRTGLEGVEEVDRVHGVHGWCGGHLRSAFAV